MARTRDPKTRSEIMASVGQADTGPELRLRRALWARGLRYRLGSDLPGRPDLVFPGARLAVFVDGCFWHGCPLHYTAPAGSWDFWAAKLRGNVERDLRVDAALRERGWTPLRVWAHALADVDAVAEAIVARVRPAAEAPLVTGPAELLADVGPVAAPVAAVSPEGAAFPPASPWWACACGSFACAVLATSGPGGLKAASRRKPERAEIVCRACGARFERAVV